MIASASRPAIPARKSLSTVGPYGGVTGVSGRLQNLSPRQLGSQRFPLRYRSTTPGPHSPPGPNTRASVASTKAAVAPTSHQVARASR